MKKDARTILERLLKKIILVMACLGLGLTTVNAHEVSPAIADFHVEGDQLMMSIRVDIEAIMAGLDLSSTSDAGQSEALDRYKNLQSLDVREVIDQVYAFGPNLSGSIMLRADDTNLVPMLMSVAAPEANKPDVSRLYTLNIRASLPEKARSITVGWARNFGPLVLRQNGVEAPYDGYLEPGMLSPEIALDGGNSIGAWGTFLSYIPIGFEHIVPLGLDHILFVLGLFLFDPRGRQLFLQITAFTAAHTITLAVAAVGFVTVPSAFVEPAIAASIIYIAVENIYAKGQSSLRVPVVFIFGLLHGLGFASVLGEFGLPATNFGAALLGFNIGVEVGQIAVVIAAYFLTGAWFYKNQLYRAVVVVPGSTLIGATGAIWLFQRIT